MSRSERVFSPARALVTALIVLPQACASALFSFFFYEFYFRIEFNELGRYFDPEESVVYTDDSFIWIFPALFFLCTTLATLRIRLLRKR